MTDDTAKRAKSHRRAIRAANATQLADPEPGVPNYEEAGAQLTQAIERRLAEIDMRDTNSIIAFGSTAQAELHEISRSMLADVRNKDVGPAGESLRDIVATIRGFSVTELDLRRDRSWWERITRRAAPLAQFAARFEEVQSQIDGITKRLLSHEHALLKDIKSLDILYEKTLAFYDELALYIAAGEEKLHELDSQTIPDAERSVDEAGEGVRAAQDLRDLRTARDDLERRVHDLKLTRQVTMQSLPSIRLVQENDKSLVTKINSTLVNTVPLWETQLAQAVTVRRSSEAADAVREANDLTNDLLTSNAENLRIANAEIRAEMERGIFDIEAVREANQDLIATIEDSLAIADEAKSRRAEAEAELAEMEAELKAALSEARDRGGDTGRGAGRSVPRR